MKSTILTILGLGFAIGTYAAKGDSTFEQFMVNQKRNAEQRAVPFNAAKAEKMFQQLDANGDGIASAIEKKIYWGMGGKQAHSGAPLGFSSNIDRSQLIAEWNTAQTSPDVDPTSDPAVQPNAPLEGYRLTWSDEFSGAAIDEGKWEYRLDSKHWSTQLAENNVVSNGAASILLKKQESQGMVYTGGGIITKKYFGYGFYEARIKCPAGAGWHTSFWMMDNHHENQDNSQIELDPLETNSIDLTKFSTDYHQWRSDIGHMKRFQYVKTPDAPLDQYHVYGMEWTPEAAYFYFNGKHVRTANTLTQQLPKEERAAGVKPVVRDVSGTVKNEVQIWFTSIATWLGNTEAVDDTVLPSQADCDYVRFFEKN